jgi:hypothetical protein
MSFASCSSSSLVPISPKYPTVNPSSAGYTEELTLIDTTTNTGVFYNVFTPITLAKGVWLLSGVLQFQCNISPNTFTEITANVVVGGVIKQQYLNNETALGDTPQLSICAVINSGDFDPDTTITLSISGNTTGASTFSIQGLGTLASFLKLVRIA